MFSNFVKNFGIGLLHSFTSEAQSFIALKYVVLLPYSVVGLGNLGR